MLLCMHCPSFISEQMVRQSLQKKELLNKVTMRDLEDFIIIVVLPRYIPLISQILILLDWARREYREERPYG